MILKAIFLSLLLVTYLSVSTAESPTYYGYSYYYYNSYYYYKDSCDIGCLIATICFIIISCCCCTGCVVLFIAALSAFIVKFAYSQGKSKGRKKEQQIHLQQMHQLPPGAPAPQYYPGYPQPVQTTAVPTGQVQYPPPAPAPSI